MDIDSLSLDLSVCNQKVMAAGKYSGKQYMVPLNYSVGFMVTSVERISEYEICADNINDFADSLGNIYQAGNFAFLDVFTSEFMYRQNGFDLIDYDKQILKTDNTSIDLMKNMSEIYDKLFPGIFTENKYNDYRFSLKLQDYNGSIDQAYNSGDLVFYNSPAFMGYYENISYMNLACEQIYQTGETPEILIFPSINGTMSSPNVNYLLLVNANTQNKETAKKFIESAIGIESQYLCGMVWGIPVNNELVEKMRAFYIDDISDEMYSFNDNCDFPDGFAEYYFNTIDNLNNGVYIDVMTSGNLFSVIREYCTNGGDIYSAISVAEKDISLYLSE